MIGNFSFDTFIECPEVTIPANSTAVLTLLDKTKGVRVVELTAGRYGFVVK